MFMRRDVKFFRDPIVQLAFAETLVWAGIFYIFPAMLLSWEQDMGWERTELSFAFSLCILVSAAFAPVSGKLIDKGFGHYLLPISASCGAMLIASLSFVTSLSEFYVIWILLGICMSGCLYEPCFAFITRVKSGGAKKAITLITLVSGLASTLSFPTVAALVEIFEWQKAILFFAGAILLIAVPLFWISSRQLTKAFTAQERTNIKSESEGKKVVSKILRRPIFWLVAIAFSIMALTHGMIVNHLLPLLKERNVSTDAAVLAVSLIGPMQVAGRLAMIAAEKKFSSLHIMSLSFVGISIASFALLGAGNISSLLVLFVLLQGTCYGVTSILKPVVTADVLGRDAFGTVSGLMAMPFLAAFAFAPFTGAFLWQQVGYGVMLMITASLAFVGFICFRVAAKIHTKPETS